MLSGNVENVFLETSYFRENKRFSGFLTFWSFNRIDVTIDLSWMAQSIWWHNRIDLNWIDGTIDLSWIAQSIDGIITINLSWIAQSIWRIDFEHMFHCAQKLFFLHSTVGKSNVFGNFFVFDSGEIQLMAQSIGTLKMLWFQNKCWLFSNIIIFPSSINVQNIKPMIQLIQLKTLFLVKHTLRKQQKFGCFFVLKQSIAILMFKNATQWFWKPV